MSVDRAIRTLNPARAWGKIRPALRVGLDTVTSPIGSILRVKETGKRIALTFDDGPDPAVTPRLLEILAERNVQATFFMLVTRVRRYPDIADAVVAAGHEIALHGLDHRRLTSQSLADARRSISYAKSELQDRLGSDIQWFRPPYGAHDLRILRHINQTGMQSVLWGPSVADWKHCSTEERWRRAAAVPGDIVLAHDGIAGEIDGVDDPQPPNIDRAAWAEEVVMSYQAQGLAVGSLGAMMHVGTPVKGARFTR